MDDMYATVSEILQSEGESVQQRWMLAQNIEESVAAVVDVDVRAATPDALWELGLSVKTLVCKVEARLCAVNKASETWPMSFELWALVVLAALGLLIVTPPCPIQ